MKRADWIFAIGTIAVISFFIWLASTGDKPTPLAAIAAHKEVMARQQCLACHDPGDKEAVRPIPGNHPQAWKDERFECTVCHLQAK